MLNLKMKRDALIRELLGLKRKRRRRRADPVPAYLVPRYDRLGAALALADSPASDTQTLAALLRAAMIDEEEDVRKAAMEAVLSLNPDVGKVVVVAASYDPDPTLRAAALERLIAVDPPLARAVARRLLKDGDGEVSALARSVVSGTR